MRFTPFACSTVSSRRVSVRRKQARSVVPVGRFRRWLVVPLLLFLWLAGGAEVRAELDITPAGTAMRHRGEIPPAGGEESTHPAAATPRREAGGLGLHIAAGSVNGLRIGPRYIPHPGISLEADAGYVRVTLIEETGTAYTDGWSVSAGGNWYMLPEADVTPLVALTFAYTASTTLPRGGQQRRLALIPSLGSEYFMLPGFSLFFRFGPAFQLTDDRGESRFETLAQFDAGLAIIF